MQNLSLTTTESKKYNIGKDEPNDATKEFVFQLIYKNDINQIRNFNYRNYNMNFLFSSDKFLGKFDGKYSPLLLACFLGHYEIVSFFGSIDGVDINIQTEPNKYSPGMITCFKGFYELTRLLLENNANINLSNAKGFIPFIYCFTRLEQSTYKYENTKICMMLTEGLGSYNVNINTIFDKASGYNILMKGMTSEIDKDEKYNTIDEIAKFLVERGANVLGKGSDGKTAVDIVKGNPRIKKEYKAKLVKMLKETRHGFFYNEYDHSVRNSEDFGSVNSNILSTKVGHYRHNSDYNVIHKKTNLVFELDDSNRGNCCVIV